jgi:hypothetical protein
MKFYLLFSVLVLSALNVYARMAGFESFIRDQGPQALYDFVEERKQDPSRYGYGQDAEELFNVDVDNLVQDMNIREIRNSRISNSQNELAPGPRKRGHGINKRVSDDFTRLTLLSGQWAAKGYILHYIPGANLYFPSEYAEIQVNITEDGQDGMVFWNQTFYEGWFFPNYTVMKFPLPPSPISGTCFIYPGYGFRQENEDYSFATSFNHAWNPIKSFIGHVLDVGSCCVEVTVAPTMVGEKMVLFDYAQNVPSLAILVNSTEPAKGVITGRNVFNNFIPLDSSKFDLPPECQNSTLLVDYCPFQYQLWGWCNEASNIREPYHTAIPSA